MTAQALYRRWRSQDFAEIIAQEHVTRTLQNALRGGRVAHAYLFTGPRGTGKTSTARILAKAVNCLAEAAERPCNRCPRCLAINAGRDLDLIEIDAASNRGIDEIRDLRDKVAYAPNEGRYKVYVIDEVHMLTTEAFNALLKTLEEPPPHVIFVLATTEPHKIPDTIVSRCQRFDFRRAPLADLCQKLEKICRAEGIRIQPAAIEAIARRASGSFRDAESLLDQLAAFGEEEITLERVREVLGGVPAEALADLVDAWIASDLGRGLAVINSLVDGGAEARQLHLETIEYLRSLLLLAAGGDERLANVGPEMMGRMREQLTQLSLPRLVEGLRLFTQAESMARGEVRPQMPLELAFAQAVLATSTSAGERALASRAAEPPPVATPERRRAAGLAPAPGATRREAPGSRAMPPEAQRERVTTQPAAPPAPPPTSAASAAGAPAGEATLAWLAQQWPQLLQCARAYDRKLEALLRSSRPAQVGAGRVVLEVEYAFHRDQIMGDKNRQFVEQTLARLLGGVCAIECTVAGKRLPPVGRGLDHPAVREDRIVRYAVEDLGAQVSNVDSE